MGHFGARDDVCFANGFESVDSGSVLLANLHDLKVKQGGKRSV